MFKFVKSPDSIALVLSIALIAVIGVAIYVSEAERHSLRITGRELTIEEDLDQALPSIPDGAFGSGAEDLRAQYAAEYRHARTSKLKKVRACEACGLTAEDLAKTEGGHLETHHVISVLVVFTKGLSPSLVGDEKNLIVLCRGSGSKECHFHVGHDGDGVKGPNPPRWTDSNPHVRQDAKMLLSKTLLAM